MRIRSFAGVAIALVLTVLWVHLARDLAPVWLLGMAIGWVLVHHRFGFSGAIRRLLQGRDPRAFHPIALLTALLVTGSAALLALVQPLGLSLRLAQVPLSLSLVAGAYLFGIGMMMTGRCGSGTLASASTPGPPFVFTLAGLVGGVFMATLHRPWIERQGPSPIPPVRWLDLMPLPLALTLQLAILLFLVLVVTFLSQEPNRVSAQAQPSPGQNVGRMRPLRGAIALGVLALGVFAVTGEPWKVLWGFGILGANLAHSLGWDPLTSSFWAHPARAALVSDPSLWWRHEAVVIDLGVIAGALLTGWSRRAAAPREPGGPAEWHPGRSLRFFAGGLLMGYGGFLAYGCNISGFLGGVMSFSLHGWVWLVAALAGAWSWLQVDHRWWRQPTG